MPTKAVAGVIAIAEGHEGKKGRLGSKRIRDNENIYVPLGPNGRDGPSYDACYEIIRCMVEDEAEPDEPPLCEWWIHVLLTKGSWWQQIYVCLRIAEAEQDEYTKRQWRARAIWCACGVHIFMQCRKGEELLEQLVVGSEELSELGAILYDEAREFLETSDASEWGGYRATSIPRLELDE